MAAQRSLYNIPSLPDELVKQKYEQTSDVYTDPNTVSNFMKELLSNHGPDAPLFEQDLPRQSRNIVNQSILAMQEHGSRYKRDPYHPELFLGDLTKDPRMSATDPMVARMAEQNKFRQDRYIKGKLQDVGDVRAEGVIGTKRMVKQIKDGYKDTATRMGGIFDDSFNNMQSRTNPHPGNSTHRPEDALKEDQTIYQIGDEKILPQYGTDVVSKLSNMIGVQWQVQPDARVGLSSVSNVYRSKQEVDQAAGAVYRLGNQDTKFKSEQSNFKNGDIVRSTESFKEARKNKQDAIVNMKKDSMKNQKFTNNAPSGLANLVEQFVPTQSFKNQMETKGTYNKFTPQTKLPETLVEPLTGKSMITETPTYSIPTTDKIAIIYKVNRTQKMAPRKEDQTATTRLGVKSLAKAFTSKKESLQERLIKEGYESSTYKNTIPVKAVDHVSNSKMSKTKFGQKQEMLTSNPKGSNVQVAATTKSFEYDTDPTINNNYLTRRGGIQSRAMLSKHQEYDNEISPLSDTIAPFKTNYTKSN